MADHSERLVCPVCEGGKFLLKYQATYVYTYVIDSDAPGLNNAERFFSFLYDNREQKETRQYLECDACGSQYQCYFDQWDERVGIKDIQAAIYSNCDLVSNIP